MVTSPRIRIIWAYFNRGDYTFREDVTIQRGRHEIHVGGEAVRISNTLVNTFLMAGSFTFWRPDLRQQPLRLYPGRCVELQSRWRGIQESDGVLWSSYVQDNIRVTSKLKVELGLRWDPYFPYTEQKGRVVCYVPEQA